MNNIKRIITIDFPGETNSENLNKLARLFYEETGNEYDLAVFDDHLDDSNWNDGDGISDICDCEDFYKNISKKFGHIPFTVHEIIDTDDIYEYKCRAGYVEEIYLGNLFDWFVANCDDPEVELEEFLEENVQVYPVKYGNKINLPAAPKFYYKD